MSGVFANRNRSQGGYNIPIIKQKLYTSDQAWFKRAEQTRTKGDSFYKTSLRFGMNPDYSPKHVGVGWSIMDTCDYVKPTLNDMLDRFNRTTSSLPMHKAYNTYEETRQDDNQRMKGYGGPVSPSNHPALQSNGFVGYTNSGGISRKEYLKSEINSVAERIARAKEVKGVLCFNNRKPNFGSFKTPPIDLALQNLAGHGGGETNMRFYMKFPIYRPRGHGPPDVQDNIQDIWNEQVALNKTGNSFFATDQYKRQRTIDQFGDTAYTTRYRANSFSSPQPEKMYQRVNSSQQEGRSLKLAGRSTLNFPRRERFNENTEQTISEQRKAVNLNNSLSKHKLATNFKAKDGSIKPLNSTKSLTKTELSRFFRDTTAKIDEDARSRLTEISRGRYVLRNNIGKTRDGSLEGEEQQSPKAEKGLNRDGSQENVEAIKEDDEDMFEEKPAEVDGVEDLLAAAAAEEAAEELDDEEPIAELATDATGDGVSLAPTEMLAAEYKKLMSQYDNEIQNRKALEEEIERIKAGL